MARPYNISETKNVFVVVGCDTYAFFKGNGRDGRNYTTGCLSICDSLAYAIDRQETCSGVGCCETKIPGGMKGRTVTVEKL